MMDITQPVAANLQQLTVRERVAAIAKMMNVSERMIYLGIKLQRSGRADLVDAVRAGTLSMHAALAQLDPPKPKDDGYTKLVKAWNAASEDEQARFLVGLMKNSGYTLVEN